MRNSKHREVWLAGAVCIMFTALQGCRQAASEPGGAMTISTTETKQALDQLARRKVFFAHQSVGDNILDGVAQLRTASGSDLPVIDPGSIQPSMTGFLAHARLGTNGDPKSKTDAFVTALESGLGETLDVAGQKFCFVDFDAQTDTAELFSYYQRAIERVQRLRPDLRIVHFTAPLMDVQRGPRAFVKKAIGQAPDNYRENLVREEFNDRMRQAYGKGKDLFDLARIESTRPGGTREGFAFEGRTVYALLPQFSTDGGHLTDLAKSWVAAQFLTFLATVDTGHHDRSTRLETDK